MSYPRLIQVCRLVLLSMVVSTAAHANHPVQSNTIRTNPAIDAKTDQLIIRFRDGVDTNQVESVLRQLPDILQDKQAKRLKTTALGEVVFKRNGKKSNQEWQPSLKWLQTQSTVLYAEPDYILTKMAVPNDEHINYQWSLVDAVAGIRADQAWNYSTGVNSVVAVVDTGVLPHTDLVGNLLGGYDMIANTFTANDGDGRDANALDAGDYVLINECNNSTEINSSWHGTHVAGTIGALANNGLGVAGVAYSAKILPVRVLGKCGGYTSDIADGVMWAAGFSVAGAPINPKPAQVINLSLGGRNVCGSTMQNAINAVRSRNTVVVAAAGNENMDAINVSPANCAGVITVAATGREGGKASYSNYGSVVDIAAPGGSMNTGASHGIISTLNTGKQQAVSDSYAFYQGTSMATPHVSGVAALMLSANPKLTPDQVESILKSSARAFPQLCNACGSGLLNAEAAVQAAIAVATLPSPVPTDPYAVLHTELVQKRHLWRAKALSNYTYVLEQQVGTKTPTRYQLTIRAGKLFSGINLTNRKSLSSRDLLANGKTIEQLFSLIETAITNKRPVIKSTYDSIFAYPNYHWMDPNTSISGDQQVFKATSLVTQ